MVCAKVGVAAGFPTRARASSINFFGDTATEAMAPAPAGVEVMPVAPVILDGDKPPSQPIHQPSSWILDGNSLEPRDMDEETPNDRMSRMSRMSTSSQFASEEDIALELQETIKQDTKACSQAPASRAHTQRSRLGLDCCHRFRRAPMFLLTCLVGRCEPRRLVWSAPPTTSRSAAAYPSECRECQTT